MPESYASNLGKRADMVEGKLTHMKSHDCHIFMETLIPIAFCGFPENIWKPITEISLFFKDLCSTTLREENLFQMNRNIPVISNKLERIFPCGFFDVMEHLSIHLVHETRLGGPVQCRWMYPFERTIGKCKQFVKQRNRIEGSICEAYLAKETAHFCSYYFDSHVPCARNRPNRHNVVIEIDPLYPPMSVFNQPGRGSKDRTKRERVRQVYYAPYPLRRDKADCWKQSSRHRSIPPYPSTHHTTHHSPAQQYYHHSLPQGYTPLPLHDPTSTNMGASSHHSQIHMVRPSSAPFSSSPAGSHPSIFQSAGSQQWSGSQQGSRSMQGCGSQPSSSGTPSPSP
nr:uncharacterized protein LOC108944464 [Nicotiana tomentosiformis]